MTISLTEQWPYVTLIYTGKVISHDVKSIACKLYSHSLQDPLGKGIS